MTEKNTVNIISLGCPRNLVDSEIMLGLLKEAGFKISENIEKSDVVIVNTCAFIEDAKKESIDVILQLAELKKKGRISFIIVSGCLAQRYDKKLAGELKEVDAFTGVGNVKDIVRVTRSLQKNKTIIKIKEKPEYLYSHKTPRLLMTPAHYAYIKIQEGCSNSCSYCVIPDIRGPYRSRGMDSILKEADMLLNKKGVSEINLIGQDTTSYGADIYRRKALPELLRKISGLSGEKAWIRLLYTHPAHFTDDVIDVIRDYPICKYIDLPIQHINDEILRKMNRRTTRGNLVSLIQKIRNKIPDVTLRTSIIVGFPGESDTQFKELLAFLKEIKFERLGAFIYSREEGSRAYDFKNHIPEITKQARLKRIMELQQEISRRTNEKLLNRVIKVLIDKKVEKENNLFMARTEADAPEVDGAVYVKAKGLKAGDFINAKVTGTLEYDLVAEAVK